MHQALLAFVCLWALLSATVLGDIEHEHHGHSHGDHDHHHHGHDHHDHASHQHLFTGDDEERPQAEQEERLRVISTKIDTDHDGQVTRDEMRVYVEQRIKEQQQKEFEDIISTLDPKKESRVAFSSYVKDNYGDADVEQLEKTENVDSRARETRRTYMADKKKWSHLDKDGDKYLTYDEFQKFSHPEDHDDLRHIEINSMLSEYDADKDGKLSKDEYGQMTEAETGTSDTLTGELDSNADGFADYEEFARYYLPTSSMTMDEETDHLLKECDTNKDGVCTPNEIVNAYSSFAGSQITDFGADLEHSDL